ALGAPAQRALRLLAVQPCDRLSSAAVDALLDTPEAAAIIAELAVAHMLMRDDHGDIKLHALVREHAADESFRDDRPADRRAAQDRLDDHMLANTWAAIGEIHGERSARPRYPVQRVPDRVGVAWLDHELDNLFAL